MPRLAFRLEALGEVWGGVPALALGPAASEKGTAHRGGGAYGCDQVDQVAGRETGGRVSCWPCREGGMTSAGEDLALWTPSLQPGEALSRGPAWVPELLSHRGARS